MDIRRLQKEDYNVLRECQRQQDEFWAETKQLYKPIYPSKQMRQNPNQQFEGSEDYVVDRKTGWKWYKEQGYLPHFSSSSSSSWQNSSWKKLDFMVVAFFRAWRRAVSNFFWTKRAVSDCPNVVPTIRRGRVHWIHTRSVHREHCGLLTITNMKCVLVAQDVMSCSIFVHMKRVCHPVSHVISLLVSTSSSPPQHDAPPGQHDVVQDDTVHRALLPKNCTVDKQR